eukprot:10453502-Karenia_brevis.AAC.1
MEMLLETPGVPKDMTKDMTRVMTRVMRRGMKRVMEKETTRFRPKEAQKGRAHLSQMQSRMQNLHRRPESTEKLEAQEMELISLGPIR